MAATPMSDHDVTERLQKLNGWAREGDQITKTFQLDSYVAGLALATAIGTLCEGLNHHPEMHIGWRKVTVSFTTHDAGSKITAKDLEAAEKIEALGYPRPA